MVILKNSINVLSYFLKLYILSSSEARFYSEIFIIKIRNLRGIIFLLLKFMSIKTEYENAYFFSVIFFKNLLTSHLKKSLNREKYLIISCIIDISASCSIKLVKNLSEIISNKIEFNAENFSVFNLFFNKISHKLSEKIFLKNKHEFFYSILSLLENLVKIFSDNKQLSGYFQNFFNNLEKILSNIFTLVGKISNSNPNKLHLNVLILLTNLFKIININDLVTCIGEELNDWIFIFLFILDNLKNKNNLIDNKLKLKKYILESITCLSISYQNEFSIYLPVLCNLGLKWTNLTINKKLSSSIEFLGAISMSTNNLIILQNNNFKEKLQILFFQIISNHVVYKQKIYYFPIFIFLNEHFNFLKRLSYGNILVNNICIKKRKLIFNYSILNFQSQIIYNFLLFVSPIIFSVIYSVINGTLVKGIFTTYYLSNLKILFNNFLIGFENIKKKKEIICFIDFVSFYRYQLPIKLLVKAVNSINNLLIENEIMNSHFFSTIERVLNVRGNDKIGIIMLYKTIILEEKLLLFLLTKLKLNFFTYMSEINLKKLFTRIVLSNLKDYQVYLNMLVKYILENFNKSNHEIKNFFPIYDFELLSLLIFSNKIIDTNLLKEIVRVGIYTVSHNHIDIFPYILDIFASLITVDKYDTISTIFLGFFKALLKPHLWFYKSLIKSMLSYLKAYVSIKKNKYNKHEIISLCCIIQTISIEYYETEYFFSFLISFSKIIETQINFFPHLLEILISKQYILKKKSSKNYLYVFIILFVDKIGIDKMFELCNRIQNNFIIYLLEMFTSHFIFLPKNKEYKFILFTCIEVFFDKFLNSNIIVLKKIIIKIFRQIACFSKIFDNKIDFKNVNNFENILRLKNNNLFTGHHLISNNKTLFVLDSLIEHIRLFINR